MRPLAMPHKKPFFIIFFFFSSLFVIRLFDIAYNYPVSRHHLSLTNDNHPKLFSDLTGDILNLTAEDNLSPREYQLLSDLISTRVPCNLLFFGFRSQFLKLAILNSRGTTVFLEDDFRRHKNGRDQGMEVYLLGGHERADKAYELLAHARENPACCSRPGAVHMQEASQCKLALKGMPAAVHRRRWDVVVVDGPSGDRPEAPGRMGSIYTAAMVAHAGMTTDVLVHDTDRMVEKWYSWEFLCHENLVSSKGRLWHFRRPDNSSSVCFCSKSTSLIQKAVINLTAPFSRGWPQ